MVTRTFQVDRYRPRTAAQARTTARLDDDGWLGYREDRALWGASAWQVVTVRVTRHATPSQVIRAINASTSARVGDVATTRRLASARPGRSLTVAWELGRDATAVQPWGPSRRTAQRFVARS